MSRSFPRPIAELVPQAGDAAFRRFGFTEHRLVTHWRSIAGEGLGALTQPLKLTYPKGERVGGTLKILAEGAAALELQHVAPMLIARINGVFGYGAVAKLKILQGPVRAAPARRAPPPPDPAQIARIAAALPVKDEKLRLALARLGAAIETGNAPAKGPGENL